MLGLTDTAVVTFCRRFRAWMNPMQCKSELEYIAKAAKDTGKLTPTGERLFRSPLLADGRLVVSNDDAVLSVITLPLGQWCNFRWEIPPYVASAAARDTKMTEIDATRALRSNLPAARVVSMREDGTLTIRCAPFEKGIFHAAPRAKLITHYSKFRMPFFDEKTGHHE